jgi:hypothetical protein
VNPVKNLLISLLGCLILCGCNPSGSLPTGIVGTEKPTATLTVLAPVTTPIRATTPTRTRTPSATAFPTDRPLEMIAAGIVSAFSDDASRNILVLVNPWLYYRLGEELSVLDADLRNENWAPVITTMAPKTADDLRQMLQTVYTERPFAGLFLVGDFPFMRMWGYPIENARQPGPADYYYMDLDGAWEDTNADGFFDVQADGQGDRDPEVFVGRLNSGNARLLGESELEMVKAYFHRNHAYRTGGYSTRSAAVYSTYAEHHYGWAAPESADWSKYEIQSMQGLFADTYAFIFNDREVDAAGEWESEFWLVGSADAKTSAPAQSRFKEIMGEGYDYLSIGIHGWQEAWGGDFFTNQNIKEIHKSGGQLPAFIFSGSCSTGDISTSNSMGTMLTMSGALLFVGFSVPSEMTWEEFVLWNQSLRMGPAGGAFWKVQELATPGGAGEVTRNVNWILLGDPTLRLRTDVPG